ncbi:MAG: LacI family DNA-binding transcriptional regulator [Lachnospiraceae bacterium]
MNINLIAQKAGVSKSTVSRVINNSNIVKPETREKVQRVIEECGYTPSAVARSLSVQNTGNIGVIVPDIENYFFSRALNGITQVAEQNQYNIFLFNSDEDSIKEHNFLNVVQQQRMEGVIISPVNGFDKETRATLEAFERNGIPVVLLDRDLKDGDFSAVLADNKKGAYLAVSRLIEEGHTRIALIEGNPSSRPVYERSDGYRQAMAEHNLPLRDEYIVRANQKSELAYEMTKRLLELPVPPTAIFTSNNMMTMGCLKYLTEQRIEVGKGIALVGFDDIEILRIIDYKLSVVNRSELEMGRLAMQMLYDRIVQKDEEKHLKIVPVELILRGSEKLVE